MSSSNTINISSRGTCFCCFLDYALTFAFDLEMMLGTDIPVLMFTDSKCIFDTITKLSSVAEKRLLIDITSIREDYSTGVVSNVAHVSSQFNLADPLTKDVNSPLLDQLMETGKLIHPINQWILHD